MSQPLKRYVKRGNRLVEGWLSPSAIDVIMAISNAQNQSGISGPITEIGVHHGRLFIFLHLLTSGTEIGVAWDLFEDQDQNVDHSGCGNREIFERNLRIHGCDLNRVKINAANSLALSKEHVIAECGGRVRLFSIDGRHTAEITRSDLELASQTLVNGGVIVLDDVFNESWPAVAEGAFAFFRDRPGILFPVVIAGNKFILTNSKQRATEYMEAIQNTCEIYESERSSVLDHPVLVPRRVNSNLRERLRKTQLWKLFRNTPAGNVIRRLSSAK